MLVHILLLLTHKVSILHVCVYVYVSVWFDVLLLLKTRIVTQLHFTHVLWSSPCHYQMGLGRSVLWQAIFNCCTHLPSWWPPGADLGYPAHASTNWGAHPGLCCWRRDQPGSVVSITARLDCYLLPWQPWDSQGVIIFAACLVCFTL